MRAGIAAVALAASRTHTRDACIMCDMFAGAAGRSSAEGVGCLFLAHRGAGAYVAPLSGQAAGSSISAGQAGLQRIHVQDESDMQQARFMESYESRHSDHSFTAAVVSYVR